MASSRQDDVEVPYNRKRASIENADPAPGVILDAHSRLCRRIHGASRPHLVAGAIHGLLSTLSIYLNGP